MVKPFPILQIINLVFGIAMIALEWPLPLLAGTSVHRSIEFRLAILPLSALACLLMYQSTNPGLYYLVGMGAYFWAFSEGEVRFSTPLSSLIFSLHRQLTFFFSGNLRKNLDSTSANTKWTQQSLRLKCQGIIQARKGGRQKRKSSGTFACIQMGKNARERQRIDKRHIQDHEVCVYLQVLESRFPQKKKPSQSQTKSNSSTKRASQDSASILFVISIF
jgi:hypothetical protein